MITGRSKQGNEGCAHAGGGRWAYPAWIALCVGAVLAIAVTAVSPVAWAEGDVRAKQSTVVRCEPEWAIAPTTEQATVCIYVEDVVGLYGADFEMSFPDMVGIATVIDEDPIFNPGVQILPNWTFLSQPAYFQFNIVDNDIGYLHYAVAQLDPSTPKTGSGPVACMRFDPTNAGQFDMAFTRHDLSDINGFLIANTANTCKVTFYDPTAVELARFGAKAGLRHIDLYWETAQEVDLLGFHLYRAAAVDGPMTRVNEELIPSQVPPGSPVGASYCFEDWKVRPNRTYYYWLEDLDIYGRSELHGPVEVRLEWVLPGRYLAMPEDAKLMPPVDPGRDHAVD